MKITLGVLLFQQYCIMSDPTVDMMVGIAATITAGTNDNKLYMILVNIIFFNI